MSNFAECHYVVRPTDFNFLFRKAVQARSPAPFRWKWQWGILQTWPLNGENNDRWFRGILFIFRQTHIQTLNSGELLIRSCVNESENSLGVTKNPIMTILDHTRQAVSGMMLQIGCQIGHGWTHLLHYQFVWPTFEIYMYISLSLTDPKVARATWRCHNISNWIYTLVEDDDNGQLQ